jgi:molybdopterin converting factor small subunit
MTFSIILPISLVSIWVLKKYFGWFTEETKTEETEKKKTGDGQSFRKLDDTLETQAADDSIAENTGKIEQMAKNEAGNFNVVKRKGNSIVVE